MVVQTSTEEGEWQEMLRNKYIGSKIEGHEASKKYITIYYKNLLGDPNESLLSLDESKIGDIPQVSKEENAFLIAPFTEDKIKDAIFHMVHNKSSGLDGFRQNFSKIVARKLKMTSDYCFLIVIWVI